MRSVSVPLRFYAAMLAVAAVALLATSLAGQTGALGILGPIDRPTDAVLAAVLTGLIVLAGLFPMQVSRHVKVSVPTTPQFAALLLLGMPAGALVAATGVAGYHALLWARGRRTGFDLLLNTAEAFTSTAVAAFAARAILDWLAPLTQAGALPAAAAVAAALLYVTNKASVRLAVALFYRSSFWSLFTRGLRTNPWQELALSLLGFMAALNAPQYPWVLLLVAIPTVIVYFSFKANHQLRTQTREAVESLADAVDMRDPYTFGHCKRVATLAARSGVRLGLPPDQVELVRTAARVHDIGKIGVPDYVLLKPGKLEPAEWVQMQRHPDLGAELLAKFPDYADGRELVRDHHERFDGAGYPRRLPWERIPLGARIIAAADAYDAMTTDRPYRAARTPLQAVDELRRHRGVQWDPQVVDVLVTLLEEDGQLMPAPQRAPMAAVPTVVGA